MDPDSGADTQRTLSLQWKSYKLLQDPAIRRVAQKVYRYDGIHFSIPDSGFPPVGELRDPRPRRIWSRHTEMSLPLPKFKLDEYYVGPIPLKEVTFARLNDNIKEPFLLDMCTKFGEVEEMEILFHPKTRKHLGLARVLFTSTKGAKDTVKHLHNTSVMGNIVHAQLDIKGQQRMKYYDLIVNGSYTPQTVPTGGKALSEKFQPPAPAQPDTSSDIRRKLSTDQVPVPPLGSATPCSLDTGFGEQRMDTPPSSLGGPYTPGSSCSSQGGGTPYTSRSGTPFSQDSGYSGGRHGGYSGGPVGGGFPAQDMLPSSSCSSSAVSSSSGFKSRFYDEPHRVPPQDPTVYHRGRPGFPPPPPLPCYPSYHNAGTTGMHMPPNPHMPPSGTLYESPPVTERERERERDRGQRDRDRERDRDSGGRYGMSRRSSYHHQPDVMSKSSYHTHHSHREERESRSYRRDSSASREHGRHRNHHHSHNHHGRRRDSRDRDGDYANSSDPRYRSHSNSSHRSSNSMSPPPASFGGYNQSKEAPTQDTPSSSRMEPSPSFRSGERSSGSGENDYRSHHPPVHPPPPPPPPPLPPASVIAAAVAETLSSLDFGQESPVREEQWSKPKRRPSTPPQPPHTPPPSSPPHASIPSSSTSPSSTSLPHHHPSSTASLSPPHAQRDSSSPEPDSTNESLPFVHHCSSLDSRIEMLLKEQKSKFSFLASDDEDEDKKDEGAQGGSRKLREEGGDRETDGGQQRRTERRSRVRKQAATPAGGGDGRKSPTETAPSSAYLSASLSETSQGQQVLIQEVHAASDTQKVAGAHTPPTYNGERQPSPHSSGEDMEISDEDDGGGNGGIASSSSSPAPSSQSALPSQSADLSSASPPDSTQHFGASMPPPHIPSYPPHLPPPPPPGFSLQPPPPPPGVPPPLPHMELHPEYAMPPHLYDYANSVELMSQYAGTSFQMQAHMLSRLHQLREKHAPGSEYPPSYHLHSLPPPSHAPHPHHPYMDQDGAAGNPYMPPHMPTYPYPDPHAAQLPPHHPHALPPPPHSPWPPHVLPQHYPSHYPPPTYNAVQGLEGEQYTIPMMGQNPHEATVQLVLSSLIDEMKNIMQRDLNRKMVENVAFGTFDEWWERKERKAKPFQTAMRAVSAVRDDEKKEEKTSSRPREPLMSLVDWAKSGGMEGFSLRGALRLPSFKVKRKEPQELAEDVSLKRVRPSTPPDEEDEDSYQGKGSDRPSRPEETRAAERDSVQRRKRRKPRKAYDLDSEGEETSDESSSEKEEDEDDSEKDESEDEALSADSDDESLSSSSESLSSSSSSSSSSSDEEDDEELEQVDESEALDTMDESTMDSVAMEKEKANGGESPAVAAAEVKSDKMAPAVPVNHRPPSPPCPRPSSPILPPLKKRRKTVSFSMEESESKPSIHVPVAPLSPSSSASPSLLLSPVKSQPPDQLITSSPTASTLATSSKPAPMLRPFASRPTKATPPSASPTSVLTVPPPVRSLRPEEPRKHSPSPQSTPAKSPLRRGKESPRTPPTPVCLTVQNLPLDHASLVRVAYEEPGPMTLAANQKGRPRGRPRTVSMSSPSTPSLLEEDEFDEDEDEELLEQRLKLREQLGASSLLQLASASTPDLSVLAHVAAEMDGDIDSEETETSDEAEEHKLEEDEVARLFKLDPGGMLVLQEHNYSKSAPFLLPPISPASSAVQRRQKQDAAVLLPTDFHQHCVQEAPEEVIGDSQTDTPEFYGMGLVGDEAGVRVLSPVSKRRGSFKPEESLEKGKSKKRTRKDKENVELQPAKKLKQDHGRKQKRGKLEDFAPEEDVDVEQLETADLSSSTSSSDSGDSDFGLDEHLGFEREEVRKSERLFLQEAGITPSTQRKSNLVLPSLPAALFSYKQRSEFEQMTILYDIWNTGLDQEDMCLLRVTYEKLLQDDHNADWLNDTHWVPHTITNIPNPRRKKKAVDSQLRQHVTGCARSEGYYAISRKEKDVYLDLDLAEAMQESVDYDISGSNRVLSERRSEQRRLLSAIGTPAVMDSDLLKLNQLKFRKKKLRFGRSRIHEWGLFAMEPIAADEMVIEYVGQNIRQMVADNREKRYAQEGIGSSYLFRVDHDTIIDATKCGNLARFINHCCTPNCYAKVITIESQKKIVIYSKQPIAVNEEITYDYKFPIEENKIPCLCGTENCRGTLN
ncbi:histone-lysine N-methyltransferase SETD1A isoform X2 [Tachysurus fulvidraco]|uniref:histone-lysine N-methyltransferase SETD1A isoform X2 n=1 Tax=Tachysurus fulvidraco TaxID=1234273 RepID=UPI001FEDBD4A|nr:histone-lysine N-methyltransferase SETD1A isoform X2 [Tachysurus fulvidraco]